MLRNWKLLIVPGLAVALFLIVFLYVIQFAKNNNPAPTKKPDIVQPESPEKSGETQNWYIHFSVKEQKSTAYTEEVGAPVASNGKPYFIGGGAVHPRYPLNQGGEARTPIIPFGTRIFLDKPIDILGTMHDSLVIMDTGDVNYGLWRNDPYWVDVYYGQSKRYNLGQAGDYGINSIAYHWYEPWQ